MAEKVLYARDRDEEMRRIGERARAFALAHLLKPSRQCYWLSLLRALAARLTFTPRLADYPMAVPLRRRLYSRPGCDVWDYQAWRHGMAKAINYTVRDEKGGRSFRPTTEYCLGEPRAGEGASPNADAGWFSARAG